jgi:hypothetical protein
MPNSGGDFFYLTPALSYMFVRGPLAGLAFYATAQIPLRQRLNGTQLAEDFSLTIGVAYGFQLFGS